MEIKRLLEEIVPFQTRNVEMRETAELETNLLAHIGSSPRFIVKRQPD